VARGAFSIDQPDGERWDLALAILAGGEGLVSIGALTLARDASGPRATGQLCVEIRARNTQGSINDAGAIAEIESGLALFDALLQDVRFAALVDEHGVTYEYVDDYETGRVRLATVAADRSVEWAATFRPTP
jgi:hypothetical protein